MTVRLELIKSSTKAWLSFPGGRLCERMASPKLSLKSEIAGFDGEFDSMVGWLAKICSFAYFKLRSILAASESINYCMRLPQS